jgi:bifunctional DNA-binding transcriptional regulator/antitoxin component of YhaV-PrlF toxin-antitoxin module
VDKTGKVMVIIPKKLAESLGIEKGDVAHLMKGEKENEIKIILEKL